MPKRTSLIEDSLKEWASLFAMLTWPVLLVLFGADLAVICLAHLPGLWQFVPWLPFFALLGAIVMKLSGALTFAQSRNLEDIKILSWREFERLIVEAYRRQGYLAILEGGGGADGGVDVRLERGGETTVVQCKHWKVRQIGVKSVRELGGAMRDFKASKAIFVTSGSYYPDAIDYATRNCITLVDGTALVKLLEDVRGETKADSESLQGTPSPPAARDPSPGHAAPSCPMCASKMVWRIARKGRNPGSGFWGCPNYPACRGTISVDNEQDAPSELRQ